MVLNELRVQDAATRTYLGSPSLVRLPDGGLLATHDYFGKGCPRNHENEEHLTSVYRSDDDGLTWRNLTHIANAYWSSLFVHRGTAYLLGCSQQYGSIVIRRSDDGGYTWSHPVDSHTGLLFKGGYYHDAPNYHCAPVPILNSKGRLYRAFEDCDPCVWGTGFMSCVVSVSDTTDLLEADNWSMSNKLAFDPAWLPKEWGGIPIPGWLEGNCVCTPSGEIWNILRFNSAPHDDMVAIVNVTDEGKTVAFNPETGFVSFPGGMTKFTIRRDTVTGRYLTLTNPRSDTAVYGQNQRNRLMLCASDDLRQWREVMLLMEDDLGYDERQSRRSTGFQYVDWQFDGDDIIYLVRTAYDGAHNYHDSNRITFHRLADHRQYIGR
ncbi:MAG: sialidase family protein [Armatimonadota bacterium]